jgi:hypothetical protein
VPSHKNSLLNKWAGFSTLLFRGRQGGLKRQLMMS